MRALLPYVLVCIISIPLVSKAQGDGLDTSAIHRSGVAAIPEKSIAFLNRKYEKLNEGINRQTLKLLELMQRREAKIQAKLKGIDSTKAAELFTDSRAKYAALEQKLRTPVDPNVTSPLKEYIPGLDSLQTTLKFLGQYGNNAQQLRGAAGQLQQVQGTLQQTNEIQLFLKEREQQLKNQLSQYGLGKQLLGLNKDIYYYQQQMNQFKALVNDPEKLGEVILAKATALPAFQAFFSKNSYLAQLFGVPSDYGSLASLGGLQSRAQVQQLIAQRVGSSLPGAPGGGSNGQAMIQQQMEGVQQQLSQLQNSVLKTSGGNSDAVMPDFKPNQEKTKPFWKRLEYGFNIQNTKATNLAPSMSTLALTMGYKLSQKAVVGIGVSYMLGLGRPLNDIRFSNEGVGFRSYVDIKAKGNFWVSGGMEANYFQSFSKLTDLNKNVSAWQKSALLGVTKKYKIGSKKQGNLQLLYDFLYRQHIPVSQALVFRMGYSF